MSQEANHKFGEMSTKRANTCYTVNPPCNTEIDLETGTTQAIGNNTNWSDAKKRLTPAIKSPIYPSSLLQRRITSGSLSVHRKPLSETLTKTVSLNLPVRATSNEVMVTSRKRDSQTANAHKCIPLSDDNRKQSLTIPQNQTVKVSLTAADETKKSENSQETSLSQKKVTTNTITSFDQPHLVNEDPQDDAEKVLAHFPSVLQRIHTARSRGVVIPLPDDEDIDGDYQEDYEEENKRSSFEDRQNLPASSTDNDETSSSHQPKPPACNEEDCESGAEGNKSTTQKGCYSSTTMAVHKSVADGVKKRKVPRHQRKSLFPLFGSIKDTPLYKACSLQKLSQESVTQPKLQAKRKCKVEFYYFLKCRFAYTPLKPIANELLQLHSEASPTEVSPLLNRSPSRCSEDMGRSSPKLDIPYNTYTSYTIHHHPLAMYTYKMKWPVKSSANSEDNFVDHSSVCCKKGSDGGQDGVRDNVEVYTPQQLAAKFGNSAKVEGTSSPKKYEQLHKKEKATYLPLPALRCTRSNYMDMYKRKVYLDKVHKCYYAPLKAPTRPKASNSHLYKKSVFPEIELNQQITHLFPTPPSGAPPASGPLSAARNLRMKQYHKKCLQEAVKLVPVHLNYVMDTPQKCIDYVTKLGVVRRKQQYSDSVRQRQMMMMWTNKPTLTP